MWHQMGGKRGPGAGHHARPQGALRLHPMHASLSPHIGERGEGGSLNEAVGLRRGDAGSMRLARPCSQPLHLEGHKVLKVGAVLGLATDSVGDVGAAGAVESLLALVAEHARVRGVGGSSLGRSDARREARGPAGWSCTAGGGQCEQHGGHAAAACSLPADA
jgi:hypothetical protein